MIFACFEGDLCYYMKTVVSTLSWRSGALLFSRPWSLGALEPWSLGVFKDLWVQL